MKLRTGPALLFLVLAPAMTPAGEDAPGSKDALPLSAKGALSLSSPEAPRTPSSKDVLTPSSKDVLMPSSKDVLMPSSKSAKAPLAVAPTSSPGQWIVGAGLSSVSYTHLTLPTT